MPYKMIKYVILYLG